MALPRPVFHDVNGSIERFFMQLESCIGRSSLRTMQTPAWPKTLQPRISRKLEGEPAGIFKPAGKEHQDCDKADEQPTEREERRHNAERRS